MAIPIEVPTGAIRYNTDSNKMECFDGTKWMQVAVSSPDLGVLSGGSWIPAGARGVWTAGHSGTNVIDYITISTKGNSLDFGDTSLRKYNSGGSSNTRGVWGGGDPAGNVDTIEYITISITGNAIDFGNLTTGTTYVAGCSNQTRLIIGGGKTPSFVNTIQYLTIASTGDAKDFGDITTSIGTNSTQCGSTTRGIVWGGYPAGTNIDYFTFATRGNAVHFGDTSNTIKYRNCTSDTVRGVAGGGQDGPGDANTIEYITIQTEGNAVDFGDLLSNKHNSCAAFSNGHGGL